jgi:hypothetical protein
MVSLGLNSNRLESWINNDPATRFVSTDTLRLNDWTHVALVRQGATRTFYINGRAAGATNNTPNQTPDSTGAAIGQVTPDDPASAFRGDIDELSVYKGALSSNDIAAMHAAGSAGKCYATNNPQFVLQPASQTNYLFATATFTGLAMGRPCVAYQWEFRAPGQPAFVPLPGETNFTLTLTNLSFAQPGD